MNKTTVKQLIDVLTEYLDDEEVGDTEIYICGDGNVGESLPTGRIVGWSKDVEYDVNPSEHRLVVTLHTDKRLVNA